MKRYIKLSLTQPPVEVLDDSNEDEMLWIIECPYCGKKTKIASTRMISGFVGCPNCYFVEGGLLQRVMYLQENDYEAYREGDFYNKGFERNREIMVEINKHDKR